jgi:hypothetical protein
MDIGSMDNMAGSVKVSRASLQTVHRWIWGYDIEAVPQGGNPDPGLLYNRRMR